MYVGEKKMLSWLGNRPNPAPKIRDCSKRPPLPSFARRTPLLYPALPCPALPHRLLVDIFKPRSTRSSRKNLNNAVTAGTNDPASVLGPDDGADALAAHDAVGGDFLGAGALLEGPEAEGGVVAGGDELAAVGAQGEAGYRGRVG